MFVVAGVSGHVGSVVAKQLLTQKQKVKVIVRDAAKGEEWSHAGAEVAVGSLEDVAFLTSALRGAAGFFTLLPMNFQATDVFGSQRKTADAIAAAVKASGVPHVVQLSSIGADLEAGTGPIKGLHYLEEVLRKTGVKLSAIRAGSFQENVENSVAPARQAGIFPNFSASADYPIPMIATRDIGALAAKSLVSPPAKSEIVDLHGPSYSYRQVAEKLGKALGKTVNIVDVPPAGQVDAMVKGGVPKPIALELAEMYAGFSTGKIAPHGDRMAHGSTQIEEVIRAAIA